MEKKLSDYLHLYLGCPCKWKVMGETEWNVPDSRIDVKILDRVYDRQPFVIAPILRPLSDMTEEEFKEMKPDFSANILTAYSSPASFHDKPWHVLILENRLMTNNLSFFDGMVLLRKHFDLFGLIEAGLAIPKQ